MFGVRYYRVFWLIPAELLAIPFLVRYDQHVAETLRAFIHPVTEELAKHMHCRVLASSEHSFFWPDKV